MMKSQRGVTMVGVLFFGFLVALVVYTASRLVPAYLDYWAVKQALVLLSQDETLSGKPVSAYREALQKRLDVSNITDVDKRDLEVEKVGDGVRLYIAWSVSRPFIGPVSLCLDFEVDSSTLSNP